MKSPSGPQAKGFADWLNTTMHSRRLSQAQLARVVGVADTQVSRWRRGQVVPTVHYLQRIADTLDVPRASLDRLAGYPVGEASMDAPEDADPQEQAELQAHGAAYRLHLEHEVPRPLWRAYAEACAPWRSPWVEPIARLWPDLSKGTATAAGRRQDGGPGSVAKGLPGAPSLIAHLEHLRRTS